MGMSLDGGAMIGSQCLHAMHYTMMKGMIAVPEGSTHTQRGRSSALEVVWQQVVHWRAKYGAINLGCPYTTIFANKLAGSVTVLYILVAKGCIVDARNGRLAPDWR